MTDDPGTPGARNWEVNVAFTMDRTSFGGPVRHAARRRELRLGRARPAQARGSVGPSPPRTGPEREAASGTHSSGSSGDFWTRRRPASPSRRIPQFGFNLLPSSANAVSPTRTRKLSPAHLGGEDGWAAWSSILSGSGVARAGETGQWVWGVALGDASQEQSRPSPKIYGTRGDDAAARQVLVNLGGRIPLSSGSVILASGGWSLSDGGGPAARIFPLPRVADPHRPEREHDEAPRDLVLRLPHFLTANLHGGGPAPAHRVQTRSFRGRRRRRLGLPHRRRRVATPLRLARDARDGLRRGLREGRGRHPEDRGRPRRRARAGTSKGFTSNGRAGTVTVFDLERSPRRTSR